MLERKPELLNPPGCWGPAAAVCPAQWASAPLHPYPLLDLSKARGEAGDSMHSAPGQPPTPNLKPHRKGCLTPSFYHFHFIARAQNLKWAWTFSYVQRGGWGVGVLHLAGKGNRLGENTRRGWQGTVTGTPEDISHTTWGEEGMEGTGTAVVFLTASTLTRPRVWKWTRRRTGQGKRLPTSLPFHSGFTSDSTSLPLTPFYHLKNGQSKQRKQNKLTF